MREEGEKAKKGYVTTVVFEGNWGSDPLGILLRVIPLAG